MARKTELKLFWWGLFPMSKEGYRHFPKSKRRYITKVIYKPELRVDVAVNEIDTKEKIMAFAEEHLGAGTWVMRGMSHAKTHSHYKWVRLAKVVVRESRDGFFSTISDIWRLSRYWFWQKRRR